MEFDVFISMGLFWWIKWRRMWEYPAVRVIARQETAQTSRYAGTARSWIIAVKPIRR